MLKLNWRLASMFALVGVSAVTSDAHAAGFGLRLDSPKAIGLSNAGKGATVGDVTTMFANPATQAFATNHEVSLGATAVKPSIKFKKKSGTHTTGVALTGGNGGDAGKWAGVPNFYALWNYSPKLKWGLSVTSPFGLETDYNKKWVGRYYATNSKMMTVDINPSFAWKQNEWLSWGGGMYFQYANVSLRRNVDFGLIARGIAAGFPTPFRAAAISASKPQMQDGRSRVTGDDWGVGFNGGIMLRPLKGTDLGISFRSRVRYKLKGRIRFSHLSNDLFNNSAAFGPGLANTLRNTLGFVNQKATAKLTTPESLSFDFTQRLSDDLKLLGSATWTRWSRFKELRIRYKESNLADTREEQKWRNQWFYALGLSWDINKEFTARVGAAFDQSPIKNKYRYPSIPDQDRTWASAGMTWNAMQNMTVNLAYAHEFVRKASIDRIDQFKGQLKGRIRGNVHLGSLNVTYKF
ncbi:MAG: OmpP1/FadL family transporter [Holosporales bacterium]